VKKKVLITGPIGGIYGRDVEANLVAKALEKDYELSFFSTGIVSKNPICISGIKNAKITSIRAKYLNNPILLFFAIVSWFVNRFKHDLVTYSKNKINAKLIGKFNWDLKIIENQIKDKDVVICFVQLSSSYLSDIIKLCKKHNVKIVIRTTGFISSCPLNLDLVKQVDLFIHHSTSNKNNLEKFSQHNFVIIDQSTTLENKLVKINFNSKKNVYNFGYVGRLDSDKGILEIIEVAIKYHFKLIIAGDGELKNKIEQLCKQNDNISYLGHINFNELQNFYKEIDVFLINSKTETGPLTGLEAMCSSCFIISKKVGAMPDRLIDNENVWIVNGLENALKNFYKMDKDIIKNRAQKNKDIYLKNYSLKLIKNKYLSTINTLLNA
jgi:glycosyltransferase involved in cell wall biosynthesis